MYTQTDMQLPSVGRAFLCLETEDPRAPGWMETVAMLICTEKGDQPLCPPLNFNVPSVYLVEHLLYCTAY